MPHERYQTVIEALTDCTIECKHCLSACLDEDDVKMLVRCIKLDRDCAMICQLAASYLASGSEFAEAICEQCAEICRECAEECRKHDMDHCRRCAEACEHCAEECEKVAEVAAGR